MGVVLMSKRELSRIDVLARLDGGRLTILAAADLIRGTQRQTHRWLEDRARLCTLLVFIDDATSRLMELRFVPSESTFAYFEALKSYLQHHGKPVAFYSDKHSIFRVSR